eukprot:2885261-Rhodomonas_salina.1
MPLNPAPVDLPTEFSVVEAALDRPGVACHVAAVAKHVAGGEGFDGCQWAAGELPLEEVKPLLRVLLGVAPRLYDPACRKQATALWNSILTRGGSPEGCLAALGAAAKKIGRPHSFVVLFQWSCSLVLAASLKEGGAFAEGAGLKKLMHLHCQLLGRVAAVQDDKLMKGCFGRAQPLFRKGWVTKLVEELPEVKDVTELVGFLHLISAHCLKKGAGRDSRAGGRQGLAGPDRGFPGLDGVVVARRPRRAVPRDGADSAANAGHVLRLDLALDPAPARRSEPLHRADRADNLREPEQGEAAGPDAGAGVGAAGAEQRDLGGAGAGVGGAQGAGGEGARGHAQELAGAPGAAAVPARDPDAVQGERHRAARRGELRDHRGGHRERVQRRHQGHRLPPPRHLHPPRAGRLARVLQGGEQADGEQRA